LVSITVTALALLAQACGEGEKAATTTTTTEQRLSKQEYIRQGDAICADVKAKVDALPEPSKREESVQFHDQATAIVREAAGGFKALKPPASDQATADQLNSLYDQSVIKYSEYVAALRSGDRKTERRVYDELVGLGTQLDQASRRYGLVKCGEQ